MVSGLNWPTYNRAGSSWATCLVLGWGLRWPEHMASAILVLGLLSTTSYLIILGPFEINWLGLFILPTLQDIVSLGPVQVFASPQLTSLTLIKPNYNIFIFILYLFIYYQFLFFLSRISLVYSTLCFGTQGFFGVLSTRCSFNWCYIFLLLIKTSIVFMVFKTLYGKSVCSCSFSLSPFQIKKMTSLICDVSCYHSFILTTTSILDKYHNRYETLYDPRILVFLRYLRSHVRL